MKTLAILVVILGLATLVMGVILVFNSGTARSSVADSIAPLPLNNLDAQYATIKADQQQVGQQEQSAIQQGAPTNSYVWLTLQRTSLGLARANIGTAKLTLTLGYLNILIGIGLVIVSLGMLRNSTA